MPEETNNILDILKGYASTAGDAVTDTYGQYKDKANNKLDGLKGLLEIEKNDAGELVKGNPLGITARGAMGFLRDNAVPAGLTTIAASGLAGHMSSKDEKLGETKAERTRRILRNMLVAGGATGGAWLAGAGLKGINDKIEATGPLQKPEGGGFLSNWTSPYVPGTLKWDEESGRFSGPGNVSPEDLASNWKADTALMAAPTAAGVGTMAGINARHKNQLYNKAVADWHNKYNEFKAKGINTDKHIGKIPNKEVFKNNVRRPWGRASAGGLASGAATWMAQNHGPELLNKFINLAAQSRPASQ